MVIDWTAAPEGTTHATIPSGDPRWYKLEGGKVFCWAITTKEWMPSFFLTVDEIAEAGLTIYANGEQSELVMLREQRDALLDSGVEFLYTNIHCHHGMYPLYQNQNAYFVKAYL